MNKKSPDTTQLPEHFFATIWICTYNNVAVGIRGGLGDQGYRFSNKFDAEIKAAEMLKSKSWTNANIVAMRICLLDRLLAGGNSGDFGIVLSCEALSPDILGELERWKKAKELDVARALVSKLESELRVIP